MGSSSKIEEAYFHDISRYNVLDEDEEKELVKSVQQGDEESIKRLVSANLRFVVSVARRYRGRGLSYLELINEGNLGLLKAAKRYDSSKNVKFVSYAVWWIRQSIQKAIFEQAGTVRVPLNKIALVNKFKKELEKNNGDFNKTMMQEEFRNYETEIVGVLEKLQGISIDSNIGGDSDDGDNTKTFHDVIGEDPNQNDENDRKELSGILEDVMQKITLREERILRMYYGLNFQKQFTLEEIGKELALTRERVRLIRDRALRKLYRNKDTRKKLHSYLAAMEKRR